MEWLETTVEGWRDWAPGRRTLRLARSAGFRAGQFLNLALDVDGERVTRSYSMASAPGAPLEFFLVAVDGGRLSPRLCALEPGDPLWISDTPAGHFTLERVPDAPVLWLLGTGTGLGPYLSMLATDEPWERFERIVVAHGVRERAHFAYRERLGELSEAHGGRLRWVGLVSREAPEGELLGGRIQERIADGSLEERAGVRLDPDTSQVLLCGHPGLVDEGLALLAERGLRKNRRRTPGHVTFEKYWLAPRATP